MSEQGFSRRAFLKGAAAAVGLAAVPVVSTASTASAAAAKDMPWAYTAQDPTAVAKRAYEVFFGGGCAEAVWWAIVEALGKDAANPDRALWASLPKKQFAFGGSGIRQWGTVCGTLMGSCAAIKASGAPDSLVDAVMMYYAETPLPTRGADDAFRSGWVPTAPAPKPILNTPALVGHTQLCHASLTQWMAYTGYRFEGPEQKDRCAKACFDLAYKAITLLNDWKSTGATPTVTLDPTVSECADSCHAPNTGQVPEKGKMACDSCHDEPADHAAP